MVWRRSQPITDHWQTIDVDSAEQPNHSKGSHPGRSACHVGFKGNVDPGMAGRDSSCLLAPDETEDVERRDQKDSREVWDPEF